MTYFEGFIVPVPEANKGAYNQHADKFEVGMIDDRGYCVPTDGAGDGSFGPMTESAVRAYQGDRMAESMRYLRAYPAELPVLCGLLPQIDTPVQIIAILRSFAAAMTSGSFTEPPG